MANLTYSQTAKDLFEADNPQVFVLSPASRIYPLMLRAVPNWICRYDEVFLPTAALYYPTSKPLYNILIA